MYAQNDALFEESDWENLERLMQSNKKDDPLKVGRFGIGFNSVYHMTGKSYMVLSVCVVVVNYCVTQRAKRWNQWVLTSSTSFKNTNSLY